MVESVVDYTAWGKGYMPPSEHVLIDALSFRGAKVILSSSGPDSGYWLVVKGLPKFRGRKLRGIMTQIEILLEQIEEEEAAEKAVADEAAAESAASEDATARPGSSPAADGGA